jgi:hypothetical protein
LASIHSQTGTKAVSMHEAQREHLAMHLQAVLWRGALLRIKTAQEYVFNMVSIYQTAVQIMLCTRPQGTTKAPQKIKKPARTGSKDRAKT